MLKFSSRALDFSIFISRQNKLVCTQMASKKITSFVPLQIHLLEIRRLGSWNTLPRQRSVIFFFPVVSSHDICLLFAVRMHCISVDFTSCCLLLMKDSLCSPLIHCRMQGKRTDYCKIRTEVLNLFPGENSAQIS